MSPITLRAAQHLTCSGIWRRDQTSRSTPEAPEIPSAHRVGGAGAAPLHQPTIQNRVSSSHNWPARAVPRALLPRATRAQPAISVAPTPPLAAPGLMLQKPARSDAGALS